MIHCMYLRRCGSGPGNDGRVPGHQEGHPELCLAGGQGHGLPQQEEGQKMIFQKRGDLISVMIEMKTSDFYFSVNPKDCTFFNWKWKMKIVLN